MRVLLLFLLLSKLAICQNSNQQVAYNYYLNGEYEKAISLYEEQLKNKFTPSLYTPLYTSLIKIGDFKKAEKISKNFLKKYPNSLQFELGIIVSKFNQLNQKNKSEVLFNRFLKKINGSRSQAINLSSFLSRYGYYHKAIEIYILSEKINSSNDFSIQKAQIYSKMDKSELMLKEYLNAMQKDPLKKDYVFAQIQKFLDNNGIVNESNYNQLKKVLLPIVLKQENRVDFAELLIWFYLQSKQYDMALRQAISLDKRMNLDGSIVFDLAENFLNEENFDLAEKAYNYIISKGESTYYYVDANINMLFALNKKSFKDINSLKELDLKYAQTMSLLGQNIHTIKLMKNYAHFKAFYLDNLIDAEELLLKAMSINNINKFELAECKMEYADILMLQGKEWQSMLYYAQLEKDFKEHPIGHEAKLRVAKISYYQCDFQWAQAQLETLRASTSKLIANNAMELSLLITDNFNLDTTEECMCKFANADLLLYQKKINKAFEQYDLILNNFPGHTLSDEIYMRKAQVYISSNNFEKALYNLEMINSDWSYDILSDDALFNRAKIYDDFLKNSEKALSLYEQILTEYPESIYVSESRKRYRDLRGDNL